MAVPALPALVTVLALLLLQVTGLLVVGARLAYAVGYLQAPEKRGSGFGLWVIAAVGVVLALG